MFEVRLFNIQYIIEDLREFWIFLEEMEVIYAEM